MKRYINLCMKQGGPNYSTHEGYPVLTILVMGTKVSLKICLYSRAFF